ncbi:MAG TPA: hypothetical protein VNR40_14985, partial [Steroidobacter sp.]|nr:hypothetical protein [Steroidobacter sp.]
MFDTAPKIRKIGGSIKGLNVLFALAIAAPVVAQDVPATTTAAVTDEQGAIEDVVVTGSRLARTGYETPTPVTVIGEGDILSSGQPNIADFVNELPSVAGSSAPSTA